MDAMNPGSVAEVRLNIDREWSSSMMKRMSLILRWLVVLHGSGVETLLLRADVAAAESRALERDIGVGILTAIHGRNVLLDDAYCESNEATIESLPARIRGFQSNL